MCKILNRFDRVISNYIKCRRPDKTDEEGESLVSAVRHVSFNPEVRQVTITRNSGDLWYSEIELDHMREGAKTAARRAFHRRTGPIFDNPRKSK